MTMLGFWCVLFSMDSNPIAAPTPIKLVAISVVDTDKPASSNFFIHVSPKLRGLSPQRINQNRVFEDVFVELTEKATENNILKVVLDCFKEPQLNKRGFTFWLNLLDYVLTKNPKLIHQSITTMQNAQSSSSSSTTEPEKKLSDTYSPTLYAFLNYRHEPWCFKIIECLLNHGGDATGVLPSAVQSKRFDITQLLLQCGANVNCINNDGLTPLHIACSLGLKAFFNKLMQYKADPYMCTLDGRNALHYAIGIPVCCQSGSGVNVFDSNRNVHLPVEEITKRMNDREYIIQELVDKGVSCNALDKYGYSPLMYVNTAPDNELYDFSEIMFQPQKDDLDCVYGGESSTVIHLDSVDMDDAPKKDEQK